MMLWKSPHFVAMDGEGQIFDPSPRYPGYYGHDRLDHPHFTKVIGSRSRGRTLRTTREAL
jgi:hypothetical protein